MFRGVRFGSRIAGLDLEVRGDVYLHDETITYHNR
jgi:hypothetical protein